MAESHALRDQLLLDQYVTGKLNVVGETDYQKLLEIVKEERSIPVIIRLRVQFNSEGLVNTVDMVEQRQNIYDLQQALLQDMAALNITAVKIYKYVPYIAMQVDEDALLYLMKSPYVIDIVEDEAVPPSLMNSIPLIGADDAWSMGYTVEGYEIVILDTGVDLDHPFFMGKIVYRACFSSNVRGQSQTLCPDGSEEQIGTVGGDDCYLSISGCGHGTHVAGIAAGSGTTPQREISGVARDAKIISIQVFSRFNNPIDCEPRPAPCVLSYTSDQMNALEWIYGIRNNYNIASVNMSLGGGEFTNLCDHHVLKPIIDNLRSVNIATVIASGNDGCTFAISAPACISTAISVGSTTKRNRVSDFSNSAAFLDLLAPGSSIFSAVPGSSFNSSSGTSMAAPHVAGAWAVVRQFDPGLNVENVLQTLANTGISILDSRKGITKPRIQLDRALGMGEYPEIVITPGSFKETIELGDMVTRTLHISNIGESDLQFTLSTLPVRQPVVPGEKAGNRAEIIGYSIQSSPVRIMDASVGSDIIVNTSSMPVHREDAVLEKSAYLLFQTAGVYDGEIVIHYDSDPYTALGLENGGTFHVAARFTPEELGDYYDEYAIEKVLVYINHRPGVAHIEIWEGGSSGEAGVTVYDQVFYPTAGEWHEYELTAPVPLVGGNEYWIGYRVTHAAGQFPAGCDEGPMVSDKGGWISGDGVDWAQINGYGLDYNWNVRGILGLGLTWIAFDTKAGSIPAGGDMDITVTFDANDLEPGVHYANIRVSSNDPDNPDVTIPVEITVIGEHPEGIIVLRHFDPDTDNRRVWIVQSPPFGPGGYLHGYNGYYDVAKAIGFTHDGTYNRIKEVRICWGVKSAKVTDQTYHLEILEGFKWLELGPNPNAEKIYSEEFSLSEINADDDPTTLLGPTVYPFDLPVEIPSPFFISTYFGSYEDDDWLAGIVAADYRGHFVEEDWEKWNNGRWRNISEVWAGGDNGWNMWIEVVLDIGVSVPEELGTPPRTFTLYQNYPNPFNPSTVIRYGLSRQIPVTLTVYNVLGQQVVELVNDEQSADYYEVTFDASHLPSGEYVCRLQAGEYVESKKMLFLK